jgi:hypothetical protein
MRRLPLPALPFCVALSVSPVQGQTQAPAVLATDVPPDPLAVAAFWDGLPPRPAAPLFTHAAVTAEVQRVARDADGLVALEEVGRSVEDRPIWHLSIGRGPMPVLLWSQMHGDEPSATPALFDLLDTLVAHKGTPRVSRLLDRLTLHVVPMLNPDGAERYQRRNAQGIDINRDALRLQTPEGRALKAVRDRTKAAIGFNLHNQNWRTSVGRTPPRPATISLLAVAFDEARTEDTGRLLTKKTSAVIRDALEQLIPGQIGRYDDEFEVRAFGDNVTKWGTPVVLIEAGPAAGADPDRQLTRLNFVALLTALDALASGKVHEASTARYESLPENEDRLFHTLIRNATLIPGTGVAPFVGDVGIVGQRVVRTIDGERRIGLAARVEDVGDLRVFGALEVIDAEGRVLAPLFDASLAPGATLAIEAAPKWPVAIAPGAAPAFLLLARGATSGTFVVERVIRVGDTDRRQP